MVYGAGTLGMLLKVASIIESHTRELTELECRENGKPIHQAYIDVSACVSLFEYFGSLAGNFPGEFVDLGPIHCSVWLEPYGVVGGILVALIGCCPAVNLVAGALRGGGRDPALKLAAHPHRRKDRPGARRGKHGGVETRRTGPLTVMHIVELMQEVLPPDNVHVVPSLRAEAGRALVSHPLIRKISFTGSSATGKEVLKAAAENLTPAFLELGGKNPLLIFEDADLNAAVRGVIDGAFYSQGEACSAASRIMVQDTGARRSGRTPLGSGPPRPGGVRG